MSKKKGLFTSQFLLLWQGQLVSQTGTFLYDIAMVLWIKEAFNMASLMGLVMFFSKFPEIILGPVGGVFADTFSKRKLIIVLDFICGISITAISLYMLLTDGSRELVLIFIFIASTIIGTASSFFNPTIQSIIPELVRKEKLQKANSLFQFSTRISQFAGQGLGGMLFSILGFPILLLINGVSFIFSAFSESFIRIPNEKKIDRKEHVSLFGLLRSKLKEGFLHVNENSALKMFLLIIGAYHFFYSPFLVILPFYISDHLKLGNEWYGFMMMAFGIGTMIGFSLSGTLDLKGKARSLMVTLCLIFGALSFVLIGYSTNQYLSLAALFALGAMIGIIVVNLFTIIQLTTPGEYHGRVFSYFNTLAGATIPIGMGFFGFLTDVIRNNIPQKELTSSYIFITCGIFLLAIGLYALKNKQFRDHLNT